MLHHTLDFRIFEALKNPPLLLVAIAETGNQATTIFFILSGFVISHSWINNDKPNARQFYIKRFLSLYPFYFICLLCIFISDYNRNIDSNYFLFHVLALQPFLNDSTWFTLNGPDWSLGVEFFLYLLFPILIKPIKKIHNYGKFLLFLVVFEFIITGVLSFYSTPDLSFYILYHLPPFQTIHFMQGILCFFIYQNSSKVIGGHHTFNKILIFGLFIMFVFLSHSIPVAEFKYGIFMIIPTIFFIIYFSIRDKFYFQNNQNSIKKLCLKAGEATFIIYISHWAWIGFLRYIIAPITNFVFFIIVLALFIVFVTLFAYLIQQRAVKIITRKQSSRLQKIQSFTISIIFFLVLTFANLHFPRQWTIQALNFNSKLDVEIVGSKMNIDTEEVILKSIITNRTNTPKQVSYCYVVMKNPHILSNEQKNPIWIEMRGQIGALVTASVDLSYVLELKNSERFYDFEFDGTCR